MGGGGGGGVLQAQVDGLFFFSIQTPVTLKASGSEIDSQNFTNLSVHKKIWMLVYIFFQVNVVSSI